MIIGVFWVICGNIFRCYGWLKVQSFEIGSRCYHCTRKFDGLRDAVKHAFTNHPDKPLSVLRPHTFDVNNKTRYISLRCRKKNVKTSLTPQKSPKKPSRLGHSSICDETLQSSWRCTLAMIYYHACTLTGQKFSRYRGVMRKWTSWRWTIIRQKKSTLASGHRARHLKTPASNVFK